MNPTITLVDGKLVPGAEVNIMLTEPTYTLQQMGQMPTRRIGIDVVRFYADPKRLRDISKGFADMADQAEKSLAQGLKAAQTDAEPPPAPPDVSPSAN